MKKGSASLVGVVEAKDTKNCSDVFLVKKSTMVVIVTLLMMLLISTVSHAGGSTKKDDQQISDWSGFIGSIRKAKELMAKAIKEKDDIEKKVHEYGVGILDAALTCEVLVKRDWDASGFGAEMPVGGVKKLLLSATELEQLEQLEQQVERLSERLSADFSAAGMPAVSVKRTLELLVSSSATKPEQLEQLKQLKKISNIVSAVEDAQKLGYVKFLKALAPYKNCSEKPEELKKITEDVEKELVDTVDDRIKDFNNLLDKDKGLDDEKAKECEKWYRLYVKLVGNPLLLRSLPEPENLSFIANMIRSGACDRAWDNVYRNLRKAGDGGEASRGVWAGYGLNYTEYSGDKNSPGKYIDNENGGALGVNWGIGEESLMGLYFKFDRHCMRQLCNSGNLNRGTAGVCGLFSMGDKSELRWMVGYSFGRHDMRIKGRGEGNKVNGKFGVQGLHGDIEGQWKVIVGDAVKISPYLGLEYGMENYEKIQVEKLVVKSENYNRLSAIIGMRLGFVFGRNEFDVGTGYKVLLTKDALAIKLHLLENSTSDDIKSAQESRHKVMLGMGWCFNISNDVALHVNLGYSCGKKYKNIHGTVGLGYKF